MKGLFLAIALMLITTSMSFGQVMGLKGGYVTQFTKPNGLNYVVDRYNETRTFLSEEMKQFNNLNGMNYGMWVLIDKFYIEATYSHRSQNRSAVGVDATNQEQERQLRAALNTLGLGIGYGVSEDGFGLIFGSTLNTGNLRIRTKVGATDEVGSLDWNDDDLFNELHFDLDFSVKILLKYFIIEPYYTFQLFPDLTNMAEVNEAINPNTFQNDPKEIPFKSGGFGLKILMAIGG